MMGTEAGFWAMMGEYDELAIFRRLGSVWVDSYIEIVTLVGERAAGVHARRLRFLGFIYRELLFTWTRWD